MTEERSYVYNCICVVSVLAPFLCFCVNYWVSYYQGTTEIQSSDIGIIFHMRYLECGVFCIGFLLECSECARMDEGQQLLLH